MCFARRTLRSTFSQQSNRYCGFVPLWDGMLLRELFELFGPDELRRDSLAFVIVTG